MNFKYAVFDMDGTLIDSMDLWDKCERKIIGEYCGINLLQGQNSDFIYKSLEDMASRASNATGVKCDLRSIIPAMHKEMDENYISATIPEKDGAIEFLKYLKNNGIKIAIATATPLSSCRPCLERLGFFDLIDIFVCTDDVGKSKRYPDVYIKAIELLGGTKEETVIFEDALYCLETLYNHNFRYAVVYDGIRSSVITDTIKEKSEHFIHSYKELMNI